MKTLTLKTTTLMILGALALSACNQSKPQASQEAAPAEQHKAGEHSGDNHAAKHGHDDKAHGENAHHGDHPDMTPDGDAEALGQDYSLYQIGGEWEDQNGQKHSLDELKGKYQVLAMAYTSCQHTCPFIVRSIKQMERDLSKEALANTSFTLVTFDTKRDTPALMTNHIKHNELNENWRWLRSDDANTRMLANTLNIKYHYAENGDINHSNTISILDKEGRLVAQGNGVSDSGIKPLIEYLNKNAI